MLTSKRNIHTVYVLTMLNHIFQIIPLFAIWMVYNTEFDLRETLSFFVQWYSNSLEKYCERDYLFQNYVSPIINTASDPAIVNQLHLWTIHWACNVSKKLLHKGALITTIVIKLILCILVQITSSIAKLKCENIFETLLWKSLILLYGKIK